MKALLLSALTLASSAAFAFCNIGDQEVYRQVHYQQNACTTPGYCNGYGRNPANGKYENYYGYHPDCRGVQQRTSTDFTCKDKKTGNLYQTTDDGPWGVCQIR